MSIQLHVIKNGSIEGTNLEALHFFTRGVYPQRTGHVERNVDSILQVDMPSHPLRLSAVILDQWWCVFSPNHPMEDSRLTELLQSGDLPDESGLLESVEQ